MKLFKPVIFWHETQGVRRLAYRLDKRDDVHIELTQLDPKQPPLADARPDGDMGNLTPELEFLTGLYMATVQTAVSWLAASPEQEPLMRGAMGVLFDSIFRAIEHTPRAAEASLENSIIAKTTDLPAPMVAVLFADEVQKRLVMPASAFELEMQAKIQRLKASSPNKLEAFLQDTLPPPTYQYMWPEVGEDLRQLYWKHRAEQLSAYAPGGTA